MRLPHIAAAFGIVQLLVFVLLARHVPLSGDEVWYFETSKLIPTLVTHLFYLDFAGARDAFFKIIDLGWFMPGMSILLTPVTLFTDSIPIARFYLGVLNFAAVTTLLVYMHKEFGRRGPLLYLLCCLVIPYYSMYCFTIWGDLIAAHLLLCLLLFVFGTRTDLKSPTLGFAIKVGGALAGITMLRGFYWMFAPLFVALFVLRIPAQESVWSKMRLAAGPSAAFILALAIVLAPWTAAVSKLYGFHLTT